MSTLAAFSRRAIKRLVMPTIDRIVYASGTWLPDGAWVGAAGKDFPPRGAEIALGFDGSDSDDWTALRAEVVETGLQFTPRYGPDSRPSICSKVTPKLRLLTTGLLSQWSKSNDPRATSRLRDRDPPRARACWWSRIRSSNT